MACVHDHDCAEHDCASQWSLYEHIDVSRVTALNESVTGSVKSVFKSWELRLENSEECLESNSGDPELIVFIPFTSDVKIKSISVIGGDGGTSPSKMRAGVSLGSTSDWISFPFINKEGIDFSDVQDIKPVQEWELAEERQGEIEYQTRYSRFQSVANLTLHFPENYGAETTKIHFIGLRGEATKNKRDTVATIVYEALPNPSDHKLPSERRGTSEVL